MKRANQNTVVEKSLAIGKIPPHANDLERAVLGAILIDGKCLDEVEQLLGYDVFYSLQHQVIYKAISELSENGRPIDLLTVVEQLKASNTLDEAGGITYISSISNDVGSTANIEEHAAILREKYMKRKIIDNAYKAIELAYQDSSDAFDLLSQQQDALSTLEIGNVISEIAVPKQYVLEALEGINKAILLQSQNKSNGIPTFSDMINGMTGGFMNFCVIAARPGEGKTAFMLECILQNIKDRIKVGVISLEMKKTKLVERILSNVCQINGYNIRDGKLSQTEIQAINHAAEELIKSSVFITDNPYVDIRKLRPVIRQLVKRHSVEVIYIDYFQLINVDGKENEVGKNQMLSQTIQKISREFDIPVIALSQQSRNGKGRPSMESLRGGGIEQACDMIINLWDELYQTEEVSSEVDMLAIVSKSKHGSVGDVRINYNKTYQRMSDGWKFGIQAYNSRASSENGDGDIF